MTEPVAPEPSLLGARASRLSVWTLAWPSMTLFALQSLVGVVDFLFVSSLGTQAIAGVGVAVQIQFLTFGLLEAVTTGTVALIAREIGSGRPFEAARVMRTALVLATLFGALLLLAIPASETIVGWMGVAPEVVSLARALSADSPGLRHSRLGGRDARHGIARRGRRAHAARDRNRHQPRQRGRVLGADLRPPRRTGARRRGLRVGLGHRLRDGRAAVSVAVGARGSRAADGALARQRDDRAGAAPAARGDTDGARARRVPGRAAALPAHRRGLRNGADLGVPDRLPHPRVLLRAGLRFRERRRDARRPEPGRGAARRGRPLGLARDRRRGGRHEQRRARDHPARPAARGLVRRRRGRRRSASR